MPCTTPPCAWPSTSSGLIRVPKSLTIVYLTTSTMPVSGSISTSATWQPLGKAEGGVSITSATSSVCGSSAGSFAPAAQLLGELHDADRAVGAGDGEAAVGELDVGDRGLEHDGRRSACPARSPCRSPATIAVPLAIDRARAAGAAAEQQLVAVALQEADALERNAEPAHQHLRERRGVALAVIERAGDRW